MSPPTEQQYPPLNERTTTVDARADEVFRALGVVLPRLFGYGAMGLRLLGAEHATTSGDPLVVGSTIPGFTTFRATPSTELVLLGSHRFSRYALVINLEDHAERTTVRMQTRAVFPGNLGRAYRSLAISSGADALGLRAVLRAVGREATSR